MGVWLPRPPTCRTPTHAANENGRQNEWNQLLNGSFILQQEYIMFSEYIPSFITIYKKTLQGSATSHKAASYTFVIYFSWV